MTSKSIRWSQRFTTLVSLYFSLCVMIAFLLAVKNFNTLLTNWSESNTINVYLDSDITEPDIEKIRNRLAGLKNIVNIQFYSKEKVIEEFTAQAAGFISMKREDKTLIGLMPSYFEISLSQDLSKSEKIKYMADLERMLDGWIGVDDISAGTQWTNRFDQVRAVLFGSSGVAFVVLSIMVIFVVSNLLKSNLIQRAKEIEILEMIGATSFEIQKPILIESSALTLTAIIFSLVSVWLAVFFISEKFEAQIKVLDLGTSFDFLSFTEMTVLVISVLSLCVIVNYVVFNKIRQSRFT